ncbi:MAG: methylated-DNA--[protein]-cysteine S-methyltransferase [Solirubrobacteraceae bacterium]
MTLYTRMCSPVGELLLTGDEQSLTGVYMNAQRWAPEVASDWRRASEPFTAACDQLDAYFAGERRRFELALRMHGTPFRLRVWHALSEIPFGETRSYGQIAAAIGTPGGARAVGLANGRNPFSIVVPCHRVVGAGRQLVGYGGGLERKRQLLGHEIDVLARGRSALIHS